MIALRYGNRMTWAAVVLGLSGLLAQQLMLRELLIVFAGNELTIGLILASWLVTEAAGTILARRLRVRGGIDCRSQMIDTAAVNRLILVTILFCLSLIPSIYAVRLIKPVLGISVGTVAGLAIVAVASLIVLAPVGLTHGAMFTLGCAACSNDIEKKNIGNERTPAAHFYIWQAVGTLLAGLLWTAVLIRLSDPFQVAFGVIVVNATVLLSFAGRFRVTRVRWYVGTALLVFLGLVMVATGGTEFLQQQSLSLLWRHQEIVHYENTMHGNIVITENQGQHTFFTDGNPTLLIPVVDTSLVEPLVHIPMVAHQNPRRILLIGGGTDGFLDAILKYPTVTHLEYHELDPRLLQLQQDLATGAAQRAQNDPRVTLRAVDSRLSLNDGPRYDIIFSRYHNPENLATNRFFSEEFFRIAAGRLSENGMLVVGFPGLVGHLNEPLQHLAAGVHHALKQVFPTVRAFPGDDQSFLIATFDNTVSVFGIDEFVRRLHEQGLLEDVSLPWDVEQRLHPRWHPWFEEFASGGSKHPIRDFQPRTLFLSLAHWSSLNAPITAWVLNLIASMNPVLLVLFVPTILLVFGAALNLLQPSRREGVIPAVMTTGFSAMTINLSLMFAFQIVAGHLFAWLGLLSAAFIAGLGLGALYCTRLLGRSVFSDRFIRRLLVKTDLVVLLFTALLLIFLPLVAPRIALLVPLPAVRMLFFLVLLIGGAVCGAQFPVACKVLAHAPRRSNATVEKFAADPTGSGLLYGADLIGGCVGGILVGIVLVPLLGLTGTGVTIGLLKAITVTILILASKPFAREVKP